MVDDNPFSCRKGTFLLLRSQKDEYQKELEGCKNNLHGHPLLSKGNILLRVNDLCDKLLKLCKPIGLGK